MSITVSDLLKLPSMVHAEVAAGKNGLHKIVSSVSVLETVNPDLIDSHVRKDDRIGSGEIVITSFINAPDNEEIQYRNVCQLAQSGEVGLIIYYVGVFLKEIPQKVLNYADENDFPIICMPKNQENLRYSDAICDIMTAIVHDRDRHDSLIVTLLDMIAGLQKEKRNTGTMIRLISEQLHSSVILTDGVHKPLYESAWPREYTGIGEKLAGLREPDRISPSSEFPLIPGSYLQQKGIATSRGLLRLYFVTIGSPLGNAILTEAAEAVRIAVNIWEQKNENAPIAELIRAIFDDDPLRMRSLASLFHIDIASVSTLWVFRAAGLTSRMAEDLAEFAGSCCPISFADLYDGMIVLFTGECETERDIHTIHEHSLGILPEQTISACFTNLRDTGDVQNAFTLYKKEVEDVTKILPGRAYYSGPDLFFASECRKIADGGETEIRDALSRFDPFRKLRDSNSMVDTLCVFLLDADQGILRTSEKLFVHSNTIKYRLRIMSDCLGYPIGSMPATYGLYLAAGVKRLIET